MELPSATEIRNYKAKNNPQTVRWVERQLKQLGDFLTHNATLLNQGEEIEYKPRFWFYFGVKCWQRNHPLLIKELELQGYEVKLGSELFVFSLSIAWFTTLLISLPRE